VCGQKPTFETHLKSIVKNSEAKKKFVISLSVVGVKYEMKDRNAKKIGQTAGDVSGTAKVSDVKD
jgi:hypothetical protein